MSPCLRTLCYDLDFYPFWINVDLIHLKNIDWITSYFYSAHFLINSSVSSKRAEMRFDQKKL